jgi:hypothetical protein
VIGFQEVDAGGLRATDADTGFGDGTLKLTALATERVTEVRRSAAIRSQSRSAKDSGFH